MAKPHKFAWNGIDVESALSPEQLVGLAHRAAQESTGDLAHGKHRIASARVGERLFEFRISDFTVTFRKYLVFHLELDVRSGRTWLSSRIDWYLTDQPKVAGLIPVGAKTMVAHFTYLQFVHQLAAHVRAADPQARITIREGVALPRVTTTPVAPARTVPEPPPAAPAPSSGPPAPETPPAVAPAPDAVAGFAPTQRPAVPRVEPQADLGMVTSVPGMARREPRATPPPTELVPVGYASLAEQLFSEDEELFQTRLSQQEGTALAWFVRFPDGTDLLLEGATVLGRNPVPPDRTAARPLPVEDPARSVSKTHALLELRQGLPWVTDLHSTNGTTLTNEVGEAVACEPGTPVPAGDGWRVGLGEFSVGILRRADG